jgi:hypothetical protein
VAFLVFIPIPLSRNVIIHCVLYSAFFMSSTIGILIVNATGNRISRTVSSSLLGVSVLCLLAWIVFVTREGEAKVAVLRRQWTSSDEDRILGHLESINATLLRVASNINTR